MRGWGGGFGSCQDFMLQVPPSSLPAFDGGRSTVRRFLDLFRDDAASRSFMPLRFPSRPQLRLYTAGIRPAMVTRLAGQSQAKFFSSSFFFSSFDIGGVKGEV